MLSRQFIMMNFKKPFRYSKKRSNRKNIIKHYFKTAKIDKINKLMMHLPLLMPQDNLLFLIRF